MKDRNASVERQRNVDEILIRMYRYYQAEIPGADVLELYHNALSGYRVEDIRSACAEHIKSSKWFPKISELIELLKSSGPHVPQIESTANVQAAYVLQMIRTNGYRNEPIWQDPITKLLFRTRWKWTALCETMTEDNEKWFVKEFVEAYLSSSDYHHDDFDLIEGGGGPQDIKQLAAGLFKKVDD